MPSRAGHRRLSSREAEREPDEPSAAGAADGTDEPRRTRASREPEEAECHYSIGEPPRWKAALLRGAGRMHALLPVRGNDEVHARGWKERWRTLVGRYPDLHGLSPLGWGRGSVVADEVVTPKRTTAVEVVKLEHLSTPLQDSTLPEKPSNGDADTSSSITEIVCEAEQGCTKPSKPEGRRKSKLTTDDLDASKPVPKRKKQNSLLKTNGLILIAIAFFLLSGNSSEEGKADEARSTTQLNAEPIVNSVGPIDPAAPSLTTVISSPVPTPPHPALATPPGAAMQSSVVRAALPSLSPSPTTSPPPPALSPSPPPPCPSPPPPSPSFPTHSKASTPPEASISATFPLPPSSPLPAAPASSPAPPLPSAPPPPQPSCPPPPKPEAPLPPKSPAVASADLFKNGLQSVCMQGFRAMGVKAQDEGHHGTSDPQLWIYETQGGVIAGKTSVVYDSTEPVWPAEETICVDPFRIKLNTICIDVRDDWPMDNPPLLNFKCITLPHIVGEHEVELDKGCIIYFTTVMAPPPSPPPPPPFDVSGKLNSAKCDAMMRDPSHIFRKMWDAVPWQYRHETRPTCFARKRDDFTRAQDPQIYFDDVRSGKHCKTNWYEGNGGELGEQDRFPRFTAPSPALLGFDESIDWFCANEREHYYDTKIYEYTHAGSCVNANHNILSLYGNRVVYNICRNLEWQMCAALGKIPGQQGFGMRFAYRPGDLDVNGDAKQLGKCRGWRPAGTNNCNDGYATDDIYYLEICLLNQICANGNELFNLAIGDFFVCHIDNDRFSELQTLLMQNPVG